MKKIALIGCGALGSLIARGLKDCLSAHYRLTGVMDAQRENAEKIASAYGAQLCTSLSELTEDADMVVEAAGGAVVKLYGEDVLRSGRDLVILSVGALADGDVKARLERAAEDAGKKIYVVNGALGGLDVMQTMSMMAPTSAVITNVKAPESLNGAPYLQGRLLPEDREETVFEGSVADAIKGFPKNVNVAVAAALATQCPDTKVVITSVPGMKENSHSVHAENGSVVMDITIASYPDPKNPKSSSSAAWSVLNLLKNLASPLFYY